ncbi:MAG TPA: hypothetical protein VLC98_02765 [Phnomibacter sp.]|nr:hypothetical protein [Phnomibacter sp.]
MKKLWLMFLLLIGFVGARAQTHAPIGPKQAKYKLVDKDSVLAVRVPASLVAELRKQNKSIEEYLGAVGVVAMKPNTGQHSESNQTTGNSAVNPDRVAQGLKSKGKTDGVIQPFSLPNPAANSGQYIQRMLMMTDQEFQRLFNTSTQQALKNTEAKEGYKDHEKIAFRFMVLSSALSPKK